MILDDLLKNPALRRVLAAGEEGVGKVMGRLLASETVTTGLQGLVSSALEARKVLERGLQQALHAANLPSREEVASLKRRLEELESMIDRLTGQAGPPRRREGSARNGAEARGPGEDEAGR
jgi:hypothetical protein